MSTNSDTLYDAALGRLIEFGPEYGGNLSSHAPMALEALSSLGLTDAFGPYVDRVSKTLEPANLAYEPEEDWHAQLARELPSLVHKAGSQAGHGLLRVGHAARALRSSDSEIRRRELTAALQYWPAGVALKSPDALAGQKPIAEMISELPRLDPRQRPDGLLVYGLGMAMDEPGVGDLLASVTPADDLLSAFAQLALAACGAQMRNTGLNGFALLHGVTVPMIAGELIPHLDEVGQRRLESAVVGFVVAAVVAFDDNNEMPDLPAVPTGSEEALLARLALKAANGTDDHDIKFSEACTRLFRRTGSVLPIQALILELGDTTSTAS